MQEPYDIDREQIIFRARAIFQKNRRQLLLWAVVYMLLLYGLLAVSLVVSSAAVKLAISLIRLALMPCLMGMYAWLHRILHGKDRAITGLLDPFRWIKTRSIGRFFLLVIVVIGVSYIQMFFLNAAIRFITPDAAESYNQPALNAFWLFVPVIPVPVYLMLQWAMDFYCIHAVQTEGRKAWGIIGYHSAIFGDTVRIEARLMARILWLPYAVYYAICILAMFITSLAAVIPILALWMSFTFLGFGLVYYPVSAIARFLLIMQQPRKIPVPEESIDFHEMDAAYAVYQKEREEYRRAREAEKAKRRAEEAEDEDGEA